MEKRNGRGATEKKVEAPQLYPDIQPWASRNLNLAYNISRRSECGILLVISSVQLSPWSPYWAEGTCWGASGTSCRRCTAWRNWLGTWNSQGHQLVWWMMSLSCWIRLYSVAVSCPHWRSCRRDWRHQPGLPPQFDVVHVLYNRLMKTKYHGEWGHCDAEHVQSSPAQPLEPYKLSQWHGDYTSWADCIIWNVVLPPDSQYCPKASRLKYVPFIIYHTGMWLPYG